MVGAPTAIPEDRPVVHRVFSGIGRFSVRFRWVVIIAWIVAAGAITHAFPSLASVVQNNNTSFLPANSPTEKAAALGAVFSPAGQLPVPIVVVDPSGLDSADQGYLNRLITQVKGVSGVTTARDLGASPDGQADQIQVLTDISGGPGNQLEDFIGDLRAATQRADPPPGVTAHVTGDLAAQVDQQKASGNTGNRVQGFSILLIFIILLLVFRALLAPLLTLLPAIMVSQIAGPVVAEIAQHGLKVSSLAQLMLIVLVLGAGTDYGLFLVFRIRENMRSGQDKHEAVIHAVERVGESIAASAGTVIAALLSLFAASFGVYHDLGAPLAIGISLMLLAALTLLPALFAVFGRAAFWPSKVAEVQGGQRVGLWGRVAARIIRRPALTLTAGVVVFGALALCTLGYASAGFGGATTGPAGSDSALGQAALKNHFPNVSANPTNILFRYSDPVWSDPTPIAKAGASLQGSPEFTSVVGPLNPNGITLRPAQLTSLHQRYGDPRTASVSPPNGVDPATWRAYRSLSQYISPDGQTVNFNTNLHAGPPSSTAALEAVPAVRSAAADAAQASGATDVGVAGQAPGLYDVSAISNSDLKSVIPIAILVIGVLLALVMRSLVAPLYLIVSVGLSYLAALGLCVLLFQEVLGDGGLTFILPFLMFLFLLALGEDYNILVMSRVREEAQRHPLREAVTRAVQATGTTVTSAGLVLAATFTVFAVAGSRGPGGNQIRDIGAGLALGILMDTFVVRTVLVPSTVVLLGRWNWWPSKLSRRPADQPQEPVGGRGNLTPDRAGRAVAGP